MANNTGIKYGGREKGTANKATARLREAFTDLLEGNMGRVQELFDKVAEKNPQGLVSLVNLLVNGSTSFFKYLQF